MNRSFVTSLLLVTLTNAVWSAEKPTSAPPEQVSASEPGSAFSGLFGITLGEKIDAYRSLGDTPVPGYIWNSFPEYILRVTPPEANTLFSDYQIRYSPASKTIYEIDAYSAPISEPDCIGRVKDVGKILADKYQKGTFYDESHFTLQIAMPQKGFTAADLQLTCLPLKGTGLVKLAIWTTDLAAQKRHIEDTKGDKSILKKGL